MTTRAAYLTVTTELLKQCLELPADTVIMSVEQSGEDRLHGRFTVIVCHDDIPYMVDEGDALPRVVPEVERVFRWTPNY